MTGMLLHTLAWTGVLIAAVLWLRRPVARAFGPEAAYALWALPLLRLVLPPITLPAWMAPPPPAAPKPAFVPYAEAAEAVPLAAAPIAESPTAGFDLIALVASLPLAEALLLVWLGGAGVFLWRRFAAYFSLRADLLSEGREVGRARGWFGPVRLIETPATDAPLAMGVLDRVIAMPPGFMALYDRQARDLALAHELAHHHGGDLLVNVLVQPLFALHWWNPLGRFGWLALRRDQEAACDARVMARCSAHERAAYAALIARFAGATSAASPIALTAPMACPVLGEKSIIHRLRSLSMTHLSPRRRMAGRALLGAGLLALPLTASISYAASEAVQEIPEPPAPPAAPVPPAAPDAPEPPQPPEAPEAPDASAIILLEREGNNGAEITEHVWRDEDGNEKSVRMVIRSAPDRKMLRDLAEGRLKIDSAKHKELTAKLLERKSLFDEAEHKAMMAKLRADLAEADRVFDDMPRIMAEAEAARAAAPRVIMMNKCDGQPMETATDVDGKKTILFCQSRVMATALLGLKEARAEIARDKDIPETTRKQLIEQLDRQIARWREREG